MKITLLKLTLDNFQGGTFPLETGGQNVSIFGDNSRGKTRLVSAYTWLLFGSDSLGRTKFQIKNTNTAGEEAHREENSVEGVFNIFDHKLMAVPEKLTFKKIHMERYSSKKGRADESFTGNTVDHYVNGVPVSKSEYSKQIEKYFGDEERYRMITTPTAFPALGETRQRELLIEVGGGITDEEVIAKDERLLELPALIGEKTVEDRKKQVEGRQKEINDKEKGLPSFRTRIDENMLNLPNISNLNEAAISSEIALIETKIKEKELQLQGIDNGTKLTELSKSLAVSKSDIEKIERDYENTQRKIINDLTLQITEKKQAITDAINKRSDLDTRIKGQEDSLSEAGNNLVELKGRQDAINERVFSDGTPTSCAACGHSLPPEEVEAVREKARVNFNSDKAQRIKRILTRWDELTKLQERTSANISELQEQKALIRIPDDADIKELEEKREEFIKILGIYDNDDEWVVLDAHIRELETQIAEEKKGTVQDRRPIRETLNSLEADKRAQQASLRLFDDHARGMARIGDLKASEKTLTAEYEQLEKELFLIKLFIEQKAYVLDDKINGLFERVKFKLSTMMNDGTTKPCCVFTVDGIPYGKGLNNASEMNGGMDICQTLARFYKINAPVFVDNAEAVTKLMPMDCQVIRLVVSEKDKTLRVEV